jgi:fibronectin-binding autotransporter adhesin
LLLTGVNGWAGSATINNSNNASLSTGPGGLAIGGSGNVASGYVRFGSSAALPTHAGSNIGYYMVSSRNALNGFGGFLFTGTGGGSTYAIPGNTQFLFSGNANGTVGSQPAAAVLGVASGNAQADHATRATVQNAVVNLLTDNQNNTIAGATASLILLARDGTLRLDNVHFRAVRPDSTGLTVTPGAAYSPLTLPGGATALLDHTGLRTLYKRGEGTVELAAALYEDGGGTTVAVPSARYAWVLGRANGTDNTIAAPYFDGAIRETGSSTENSLTGFSVTFQGAVLESANSLLGGGFTRALGTATNQVRWAQGGGGFSAADGPLRVNIGGTSATLAWGGANFVPANNPLLFGSRTTRGAVTFENGLDLLNTNNSGSVVREIRVYDNQSSAADFAAITGPITQTGTGTSAGGLSVGGDGRLDLNGSLTYAGTTAVASGRLNINGTLSTGSAAVTIAAGATLGGTGVIGRPVTVSGQLDPGITTGTLGFG